MYSPTPIVNTLPLGYPLRKSVKLSKTEMPLFKLTTGLVAIMVMIIMFGDIAEAKREKGEQKWRSCWVTRGGERTRLRC